MALNFKRKKKDQIPDASKEGTTSIPGPVKDETPAETPKTNRVGLGESETFSKDGIIMEGITSKVNDDGTYDIIATETGQKIHGAKLA